MSDYTTDFLNNTSTGGTIAVNGINAGYIAFNADRDWFRISLVAGVTYDFSQFTADVPSVGGQPISVGTPNLLLRDSNGLLLKKGALSLDGNTSLIKSFVATATGTYYLDAGASTKTDRGFYGLTATQVDDYLGKISSYNPDITAPYYFNPLSTTTNGRIEFDSDKDLFKVSLTAGLLYSFNLNTFGKGGSLKNPFLRLLSSSNKQLASNDNISVTNPNSYFTYTPKTDGVYYLEASGVDPTDRGAYHLTYAQTDDYIGTIGAKNPDLTVPYYLRSKSLGGNIQFDGDTDLFRVDLTAGYLYKFGQSTDGNTGSLIDPSAVLLDANKKRVASSTDPTAINDFFTFTPKTSGSYYLQAGGKTLTDSGSYTVSAQLVDEILGNKSTTGNLTYTTNNSYKSSIDFAGDSDWYYIYLYSGIRYDFSMTSGGQKGDLLDPFLALRTSTGDLIKNVFNNDISSTNTNSLFSYTPTTTGYYFLDAKSNPANKDSITGVYTVDVDQADDNYGVGFPSIWNLGTVSLGDTITGKVEFDKDTDYFRVYLEAGRTYRFSEVTSGQPGSLADPYLKLRDSSGTLVPKALNDNVIPGNVNSFFTYTPTVSNYFILDAGSASPTDRGTYTVGMF